WTIAATLQFRTPFNERERVLTYHDVQVNNLTPHAGPVKAGARQPVPMRDLSTPSSGIPPGQPTPETENPKMSTTTPRRTARDVPRRTFLARVATGATAALLTVGLAACGSSPAPSGGSGSAGGGEDKLSLGFAQVGAESGWRTANTKSIQDAAAAA